MTSTERGTPIVDAAVWQGHAGDGDWADVVFADVARKIELDLRRAQEERDAARHLAASNEEWARGNAKTIQAVLGELPHDDEHKRLLRILDHREDYSRSQGHELMYWAEGLLRQLTAARQEAEQRGREVERLRAGLDWYAQGHHYDLPDWEDCSGESANWLFPPTEHGWMVDNGGIAKGVLAGYHINPNHADADLILIAPIENTRDHDTAMARIEELMNTDPAAYTPAAQELILLAEYVEKYELAALSPAREVQG